MAVSGVSLNKSEVILEVGATETLTATVAPEDATTKTVSWQSSNEDVATVDQNGKVTAISKGEVTITVTTNDGNKTATCKVTVTADPSDSTESESPTDPTEDETTPTEPETPTDGKPESSTPGTGDNFPLVLITLTLLLSLVGMIVLLWSKRSMNGKHVK